jgi:hypothetical protein
MKVEKVKVLESLVSLDKNTHELKRLATLLLNAFRDWPDDTLDDIRDFKNNVAEYFDGQITIERIKNVQFDGQNAWHLETGKYLVELLDRAERFLNIADFDTVVNRIINFYSQEFEKVDFEAHIKLFRTEDGGVKSFVLTGYKPFLKFHGNDRLIQAEIHFEGKDALYAGDEANCRIKLSDITGFENYLFSGLKFEVRNANSIIGVGEVSTVVHIGVKKANWTDSFANNSIFMVL